MPDDRPVTDLTPEEKSVKVLTEAGYTVFSPSVVMVHPDGRIAAVLPDGGYTVDSRLTDVYRRLGAPHPALKIVAAGAGN